MTERIRVQLINPASRPNFNGNSIFAYPVDNEKGLIYHDEGVITEHGIRSDFGITYPWSNILCFWEAP
jgi:hypothetical protein